MYKQPKDYIGESHKYQMPSDDIDPKEKYTKDFYKCVGESLMAEWASGNTIYPMKYHTDRSIRELHDFAKGRQNMDEIKKSLLGTHNKKDGGWVTKMNISWQGYDKLPQLFDIMRSKNIPLDYNVDLNCIDEKSANVIQWTREALKFIVEDKTSEFMEQASFKMETEIDPEQLGIQTSEDVDTFFDAGGFMLQWQIAAQALISKSKEASDYKEFQDTCFDNLITNPDGFTGAKTYIEKSTGIPKFRALNMENVICPYFSGYTSKNKLMRAGEVREMTIAEIRRENPSLSIAELKHLAKCFSWLNPRYASLLGDSGFYGNLASNTFGNDPINSVKVLVLDYQFISSDVDTYIKNQRRGFFKETDYDKKLSAKNEKYGDEIIRKKVLRKHEAMWVIGTDYFLSYGQCEDNVYYGPDGNKTPGLDFFFVKINNKSLVERCVALVNDMNMILIKYRNTWATLPAAPAMAIQRNLVENVFLHGKKQTYEQLQSILQEKGVFFYDALDDFGKPLYMAGGQKPIDYINVSPIVSMLQACSQELAIKVNEIKEVLGMQGGVDGGQRSPYQGLGETQLYMQAANDSLTPTFNGYSYLWRDVATDIIMKGQVVAQRKKMKLSYSILSPNNMKMLELTKDFSNAEFNVAVRPSPSNQEKVALLTEITNLKTLHGNTDGAQGISHAQYLYVYDKIMLGQFKQAYFVLAKIDAKRRAEAARAKQMDQEFNIKSQQESAKMKANEVMTTTKTKGYIDGVVKAMDNLQQQNNDLTKIMYTPQSEGTQGIDKAQILSIINSNNIAIQNMLMQINPSAQPPEQEVQDPMMQQQQGMPYQEAPIPVV